MQSQVRCWRSYRTYEEWKPFESSRFEEASGVLTVPMRNGNKLMKVDDVIHLKSSYRTYEEWKRQ